MKSVIYRFIDDKGDELLACSSYEVYQEKIKTARQLIETVGVKHEKKRIKEINNCDDKKLKEVLTGYLDDPIHVEHPC